MKQHPVIEDLFALLSASGLISLGVFFLEQAGLLSGGTAGLSMVLARIFDFSFGQVFFAINMPFYYLGWKHMGSRFTINTAVSVAVISFCTDHLDTVVQIESIGTAYAATIAGVLTGVGMLILFRHNASLGGVGILAIHLQKKFSISSGATLLVADLCILVTAFFIVDLELLALSAISVLLISLVLVLNHKPYRYQLR